MPMYQPIPPPPPPPQRKQPQEPGDKGVWQSMLEGKPVAIYPRSNSWAIDEWPYPYTEDLLFFTRVLINSGYRPYALRRADNGRTETVWAKASAEVLFWKTVPRRDFMGREMGVPVSPVTQTSVPDLSGYAAGEVTAIPWHGMLVERDAIIYHGRQDSDATRVGTGEVVRHILSPSRS